MALIFKNRSKEKEILDDFELQGNDLSQNLRELQRINTYLGGYSIAKEGINEVILKKGLNSSIRVADIGCGGGDTLRELAKWGMAKSFDLHLTGIDANENAIAFSRQQSEQFPEIDFRQINILSKEFHDLDYDIVTFNLFAHHFEEEEIIAFLQVCKEKGAAVVINDLQRSVIAYGLFRLTSTALNFSQISRHDGLLSIRKAFTHEDWKKLLEAAGFKEYSIKWRWAFRYLVTAW